MLPTVASAADASIPWRIRFLEAAVVEGPLVKLGEVAVPVGEMPPEKWAEMSSRELWPSPAKGSRAVNMTRPRLQEAVVQTMRDLAPYCLFPGSMALQRGGKVLGKEEVRQSVEASLKLVLASLPGEVVTSDFRLPAHVFLEHAGQSFELEPMKKPAYGRISLRMVVKELDGTIKQKLTGSVMVECWADVPSAAKFLNKDDLLEHQFVVFKRANLSTLRNGPWDGRGGPWRMVRAVVEGQVIYQNDLAHIPTIRKGALITLIYEGQTVRLKVQAEAMADGVTGETIVVRNLQSKKEVYATVRDATTVVITGRQ